MNESICWMILFVSFVGLIFGDGWIVDGSRGEFCDGLDGNSRNIELDFVSDNGLLIVVIESIYKDFNNFVGGIWINDCNVVGYNVEFGG